MRQSWMKNIFLFSAVMLVFASCANKEFSKDEPLIPEQKPTLYISSESNMLYALNPENGDVRWKFYDANGIVYEPLALDKYVFVTTTRYVIRLNAIDGKPIDTVVGGNYYPDGPPVGDNQYIYLPKREADASKPRFIQKYDFKNNADVGWTLPTGTNSIITSSPVMFGGDILFTYSDKMILVSANDASSLIWTISTGIKSNPVVDGVNVFITAANDVVAYSYQTGLQSWNFTAPDQLLTSPILYGGNILYGCADNQLYCVDSIAHTPRWTFKTDERVFSSPYAYDQTIYFGSNDHYFYAVNVNDGSLKWKYRTNGLIKSSPIAYNGMVYVASYDQNIYAFDTTGALRWKYQLNGLADKSPVFYDPGISKGIYPAVSGMSTQ